MFEYIYLKVSYTINSSVNINFKIKSYNCRCKINFTLEKPIISKSIATLESILFYFGTKKFKKWRWESNCGHDYK